MIKTTPTATGQKVRATVFHFNDVEIERVTPRGGIDTSWNRLFKKLTQLMHEGWEIQYEEYWTSKKRDKRGKFLPKHLCCRGTATLEETKNV